MKVKELIRALQNMNPDSPVIALEKHERNDDAKRNFEVDYASENTETGKVILWSVPCKL